MDYAMDDIRIMLTHNRCARAPRVMRPQLANLRPTSCPCPYWCPRVTASLCADPQADLSSAGPDGARVVQGVLAGGWLATQGRALRPPCAGCEPSSSRTGGVRDSCRWELRPDA